MAERRKLTRFAVSAPVRLMMGHGTDCSEFETLTRDLSADGAYIYLDASDFGVGEHVTVEIDLRVPGTQDDSYAVCRAPMVGTGEVRRVDARGVALAFGRRLHFA